MALITYHQTLITFIPFYSVMNLFQLLIRINHKFPTSSILGNYYYGEANVRYLTRKKWILNIYRILVGGMVLFGALAALDVAWSLADVTMGLMALCNLIAISLLGKYAY